MNKQGDMSAGPLIIGVTHAGKGNAEELTRFLEQQGISEGQTIAIEGFSRHEKIDLQKLVTENLAAIAEFKQQLQGYRLLYRNDIITRKIAEHIYNDEISRAEWNAEFYSYLIQKKINVIGWDVFSQKAKKLATLWNFHQRDRRDKIIAMPIRNRIASNSIKATQPNFVVCGQLHAKEIGQRVPNRGVVELNGIGEKWVKKLAKKYEGMYRRRMLFRKLRRMKTKVKKALNPKPK